MTYCSNCPWTTLLRWRAGKISRPLLKPFYWLLLRLTPSVNKSGWQIKPLLPIRKSEDDATEEALNYPKIGGEIREMRECENHQSAAGPQVLFFVKLEKLYFICRAALCAVLISRPFSIGIMGLVTEKRGKIFCSWAAPVRFPFFFITTMGSKGAGNISGHLCE